MIRPSRNRGAAELEAGAGGFDLIRLVRNREAAELEVVSVALIGFDRFGIESPVIWNFFRGSLILFDIFGNRDAREFEVVSGSLN